MTVSSAYSAVEMCISLDVRQRHDCFAHTQSFALLCVNAWRPPGGDMELEYEVRRSTVQIRSKL